VKVAMLGQSKQYYLSARFPRMWQANVLQCCAYSIISTAIAIGICITITGDLKANAIPEIIFTWFRFFLFASGIAALYWVFKSTRHFRVGAAGYKIASPPLLLLFVVIASLWVAPFLYAYCANSALRATATSGEASVGYLRMLRAATLFNADTHYEPLKPSSEIGPLEPYEKFTVSFVKGVGEAAVQPIEIFAPVDSRGVLLSLLKNSLPLCAQIWSLTSKADAVAAVQGTSAPASGRPQTEGEQAAARSVRASQLDRIDAELERATRLFGQCLDSAIQDTKLDKDEIARGFKIAQRNAYLVHHAHKSFGQNSADYLQYVVDQKFAAPELLPLGLGDVTVLAAVVWLVSLMSVFYLAGEYVDSTSFASVIRNVVLVVMVLLLVLSLFGLAPPIPRNNNNPLIYDALASVLHWPSLAVMVIGAVGIAESLLRPSTSRTRFTILMAFLCVPASFGIETLNAVNTLASIDYQTGGCPRVSWILADRLHCAVYSVWQPFVRDSAGWLANQFHWPQFWLTAGGRAAISVALSILVAWPVTSILLVILKREYVRPRDK
jgi:hypothetical protein